eukprot:TRINITY_DN75452_c0_g1_i1.p1 TRINITY_DN75452_c0_g1~~TRINITY_DN75452_c0_g1_i1.p1  ORF type:complete len:785 (+),score=77.67 TRINITY_DN75452_c0_g1_i1:200-2554(+)
MAYILKQASTMAHLGYLGLVDMLSVATRPMVFLGTMGVFPATAETLRNGGVLVGLVGTISVMLLAFSISVLGKKLAMVVALLPASLYLADAGMQVQRMLLLDAGHVYPVCNTGIAAPFQLAASIFALGGFTIDLLGIKQRRLRNLIDNYLGNQTARYGFLSAGLILRYISMEVPAAASSSRWLYVLGLVSFAFGVTPKILWDAMGRGVAHVGRGLSAAFAVVYLMLSTVLPKIYDAIWACLMSPPLLGLYAYVVEPLWCRLAGAPLPIATSLVALSCANAARQHLAAGWSPLNFSRAAGLIFVGSAAAMSSLVLGFDSAGRLLGLDRLNPLRFAPVAKGISGCAYLITVPWFVFRAVCKLLWKVLGPVLEKVFFPCLRLVCEALHACVHLAFKAPLLSVPCVLIVNFFLLTKVFAKDSPFARMLESCFSPVVSAAAWTFQRFLGIKDLNLSSDSDDVTFALVLLASIQVASFLAVHGHIQMACASQHASTGTTLSIEDLNGLAEGMRDPRCCGCCGFGPIDHSGCNSLTSHHGEVRVRGGRTDNSCPRCGWFVRSLQDWPSWSSRSDAGHVVVQSRVWSDVVLILRSSSKALVIPYFLIRLGAALEWNPSLSAYLALSYLLPWVYMNVGAYNQLQQRTPVFIQRQPRASDSRFTERGGARPSDDADCGASTPLRGPAISETEALRNLRAACPNRVFLWSGDACSVCLEDFPAEAAAVAERLTGAELAVALQDQTPPIIGLRCGHTLHTECAEAAVRSADGGQARCPLCREPVTMAGAAAARLFT